MTTRLTCLASVLAAGIALMIAANTADAKGDRHHSAETEKSSSTIEKEAANARKRSDRHTNDGRKRKDAEECRRHCKDNAKKAVPVTVVGSTGKTVVRLREGEVLAFEANTPGQILIREITTTPGVFRTVTLAGDSITLSSRTANGLRLELDGKAHNIESNGTVSFKQNSDGSITVTAKKPPVRE